MSILRYTACMLIVLNKLCYPQRRLGSTLAEHVSLHVVFILSVARQLNHPLIVMKLGVLLQVKYNFLGIYPLGSFYLKLGVL